MKAIAATVRILAVIAGIALGALAVHTQQHRDTCDHYKTELSAAVSDPASTGPIVGLDRKTTASIQTGRQAYQQRTGEFALSGVSDLSAAWTRFADGVTAQGLAARGC